MQHFDFSDYSRLSNEVTPTKLATGIDNDINTNTVSLSLRNATLHISPYAPHISHG